MGTEASFPQRLYRRGRWGLQTILAIAQQDRPVNDLLRDIVATSQSALEALEAEYVQGPVETNSPLAVRPGLYRHYKGGLYFVSTIAYNSDNGVGTPDESWVVYYSLKYGVNRVRRLTEFTDMIDGSEPGSPFPKHRRRFERVEDEL